MRWTVALPSRSPRSSPPPAAPDLRDNLSAFRAESDARWQASDARWQASDARWHAQQLETLGILEEMRSQRERLERERLLRERNMRSVTEILEHLIARVRRLAGAPLLPTEHMHAAVLVSFGARGRA